MVRKNQIKKFTVQQILELSKTQKDGQILKLFYQQITTKNSTLSDKRDELIKQISRVRKDTIKTVKQMNETVKQRLHKKQKLVMDRNSRPTLDNIKSLSDLFAYMQNQSGIMDRNNKHIEKLFAQKQKQLQQLIETPKINIEYKLYDQEYEHLKLECRKEQNKKQEIEKMLQLNRTHYDTIQNTIQQYRVKYSIVQAKIADKQKELDHLMTYFKTRQLEDSQNIQRQNGLSQILQTELLKAQKIFYFSECKKEELQIRQIECLK